MARSGPATPWMPSWPGPALLQSVLLSAQTLKRRALPLSGTSTVSCSRPLTLQACKLPLALQTRQVSLQLS